MGFIKFSSHAIKVHNGVESNQIGLDVIFFLKFDHKVYKAIKSHVFVNDIKNFVAKYLIKLNSHILEEINCFFEQF